MTHPLTPRLVAEGANGVVVRSLVDQVPGAVVSVLRQRAQDSRRSLTAKEFSNDAFDNIHYMCHCKDKVQCVRDDGTEENIK